jgi:phosphomannomutase
MVTSSHNPWNWNGVKFKAKFGGSATPAIMKVIEEEVAARSMPKGQKASIEEVDLTTPYSEAICRFADLDLIAKAGFKFAVDSMYGSGRGVLTEIFRRRGIHYVAIRQEINPLFPGINPEPIEPHIEMLRQTVLKENCHAGLAADGDADRIGAIAEDAVLWIRTSASRSSALGWSARRVWRRGTRLQHHRHGGSHRRQIRTQIDRVPHRIQTLPTS